MTDATGADWAGADWAALARQIADANEIGSGARVGIVATDSSAAPAVEAFVAEVYRRGGLPQVVAAHERFDRIAVAHASAEMLGAASPVELWLTEWADVHVSFRAMVPPVDEPADAERLGMQRAAKGAISTARWRNTRWTLVRVPTPEWAAVIGVPYERLLGEFFAGVVADWSALGARWDALCQTLDSRRRVRILSDDTDLVLGVAGRTWVSFAGDANLPDGEIATAPLETEVDGHISFPGRFWFAGERFDDLRLSFEGGRVVDVAASEGAGLAERLLDTDDGSRLVGELGIGTNAAIQTMTGDLLIDEKILGTVHIALGRAYPECGGTNESSLHWDIVKDLRVPSGHLSVDDLVLIDGGRVLEPLAAG